MSSFQRRMLDFIHGQLEAIHLRPGMRGPDIAVELQILQLLEFRSVVLRPTTEEANPRAVMDAYEAFLARRFPGAPTLPLASLLARDERSAELRAVLDEFRRELVDQMLPEERAVN